MLHGRTCVTSHGLWRGVMMWNLERGQNFRGDCNPSVHTIQEYTLRRSDATHRSSQCLFACHDPCYCRLTWLVARGGNSVLITRSGLKEAAQRATAPPDEHEEDGGVWGWRAGDAHVDATSATPSARCPGPCGSGWCSASLLLGVSLGGLRAGIHHSRSVRRLVTSLIAVSISGSSATRSQRPLEWYPELAALLVSRAISRCKVGLEITGDTTTGAGAE